MNQDRPASWKIGIPPVYVLSAVIGVMGLYGKKLMSEHEHVLVTLGEDRTRIVVLEEHVKDLRTEIRELKK